VPQHNEAAGSESPFTLSKTVRRAGA